MPSLSTRRRGHYHVKLGLMWYHVAAVKQGGELKLYLDGRARGTTLNAAFLFS